MCPLADLLYSDKISLQIIKATHAFFIIPMRQ